LRPFFKGPHKAFHEVAIGHRASPSIRRFFKPEMALFLASKLLSLSLSTPTNPIHHPCSDMGCCSPPIVFRGGFFRLGPVESLTDRLRRGFCNVALVGIHERFLEIADDRLTRDHARPHRNPSLTRIPSKSPRLTPACVPETGRAALFTPVQVVDQENSSGSSFSPIPYPHRVQKCTDRKSLGQITTQLFVCRQSSRRTA